MYAYSAHTGHVHGLPSSSHLSSALALEVDAVEHRQSFFDGGKGYGSFGSERGQRHDDRKIQAMREQFMQVPKERRGISDNNSGGVGYDVGYRRQLASSTLRLAPEVVQTYQEEERRGISDNNSGAVGYDFGYRRQFASSSAQPVAFDVDEIIAEERRGISDNNSGDVGYDAGYRRELAPSSERRRGISDNHSGAVGYDAGYKRGQFVAIVLGGEAQEEAEERGISDNNSGAVGYDAGYRRRSGEVEASVVQE